MGANGADVVLRPSLIQSHSCRTIGLNGNGIIRVTSIVICLADFSYGVLRSCEVKYYKNQLINKNQHRKDLYKTLYRFDSFYIFIIRFRKKNKLKFGFFTKNVADDEVLVGSPSAVSGNTRRDCPTQCITHLKGCLCH